ncbi:hypothetical protein OGAPHI_001743 [Ogataea philodendri]|uniref:Uncharacterized protein n=1 Tax=Ogataea philodendri TaxID=1378263 RepID=A0A9P8PAN4_9ASCO|nr:uncharacterized protein OGAPHI_001743 [Ogataea philodendri]KAH3667989.1 hypothetical protein OGAPHI_001743 [Ogataea philodendri]
MVEFFPLTSGLIFESTSLTGLAGCKSDRSFGVSLFAEALLSTLPITFGSNVIMSGCNLLSSDRISDCCLCLAVSRRNHVIHIWRVLTLFEEVPDGDVGPPPHRNKSLVRDVHRVGLGRGVVRVDLLEVADVPELERLVCAGNNHVAAVSVDGDVSDGTTARHDFGQRSGHAGRPQSHLSVGMAQMHHGVPWILTHTLSGSELSAVFGHEITRGNVVVLQKPGVSCRGEQEMVRQKVQQRGVDVLFESVQFHSRLVVDKHVLLLRDGKVLVIVQILDRMDGFVEMELAVELALSPVERSHMALLSADQQVAPVSGVV